MATGTPKRQKFDVKFKEEALHYAAAMWGFWNKCVSFQSAVYHMQPTNGESAVLSDNDVG